MKSDALSWTFHSFLKWIIENISNIYKIIPLNEIRELLTFFKMSQHPLAFLIIELV